MRMNAMPLSAGSASRRLLQASRPPADAPIPTTGKWSAATEDPRPCMTCRSGDGRAAFALCGRPDVIILFLFSKWQNENPSDNHRLSYFRTYYDAFQGTCATPSSARRVGFDIAARRIDLRTTYWET